MSEELFNESHRVLIDLAKWVGAPMYFVKKSDMELFGHLQLGPGSMVSDEIKLENINPLKVEVMEKILVTFCNSHQCLIEKGG